jgi:hypothetical protein
VSGGESKSPKKPFLGLGGNGAKPSPQERRKEREKRRKERSAKRGEGGGEAESGRGSES